MTPLASFLNTRSPRAAVVLAVVLHGAVLFGFAQYDHTRSSMGQRQTVQASYQPVEVIFVAAHTPAESAVPAPVSMPAHPLAPAPVPLARHKPAPEPHQAQQASPEQETLPRAPLAAAAGTGVAGALAQDRQDEQVKRPPGPTTAGSEEARPEAQPAQPMQAAKPDYAYNPQPDYPMLLREQGVGGVVWLRVWVDSEGHPGEIKLAKGSGYRLLDDAALLAVRQWRFTPARRGDNKLASWVEFPIRFTLNG